MAILSTSLPSFTSPSSSFSSPTKPTLCPNPSTSFFNKKVTTNCQHENMLFSHHKTASYRYSSWGRFTTEEEEEDVDCCSFQEAVELFNKKEYYRCHDVLESLWNKSQEPTRTLVHGILQCAVGFHHLFNQVIFNNYCYTLYVLKWEINTINCDDYYKYGIIKKKNDYYFDMWNSAVKIDSNVQFAEFNSF